MNFYLESGSEFWGAFWGSRTPVSFFMMSLPLNAFAESRYCRAVCGSTPRASAVASTLWVAAATRVIARARKSCGLTRSFFALLSLNSRNKFWIVYRHVVGLYSVWPWVRTAGR